MDHSAKPMVELIVARKRLMGQLAWPGPKSVLNDVESCVILTKLLLWVHEVQEDEDIPDKRKPEKLQELKAEWSK